MRYLMELHDLQKWPLPRAKTLREIFGTPSLS